jgi:exopolysaccharide production protein ExoZ
MDNCVRVVRQAKRHRPEKLRSARRMNSVSPSDNRASDRFDPQRVRLRGIEMLRGLAATLVVMHHSGHLLREGRYGGVNPFHGLFDEFHAGVDFFFVLSGFIIASVHWDDLGNRSKLRHYAARRFTRIYPAYWALLIPLAILYHLFPANGLPERHDWSNFVMSFLLLPYPTEHMVLGVAWTLVYEVCFYAIFGGLIFMGRKSLWLLPVWGLGILVFSASRMQEPYSSFFFNAYNLNFLFGIGAALILRRFRIPYAWLALAMGGSVFLGAMLGGVPSTLIDNPVASRLIFGLSAALVMLGMVELERSGKLAIPSGLQLLGAASYSIYLVHPVAMSLSLLTCWRFVKTLPPEIMCVPLVVIGVAAGIIYHKAVETRVMAFARRAIT